MRARMSSDSVAIKLQIPKELYKHIADEAGLRGHSPAQEIVHRLRGLQADENRQVALNKITATVQAADSTINAIERLLTIVKPPSFPALPKIDPTSKSK